MEGGFTLEIEWLRRDDYIIDILKKHGNTVLRVAFSYLKDMAEAEDVYQEVFLKLLEDTVMFQSADHEKAWLIRVTINLCKNRFKSFWKSRILPLDNEILFEAESDIAGSIDVFNAVMSLKPKYRTVINLFYYEGYSTLEISKLTGWSESTVRTSLHRGRKILSGKLEGVVLND
jgi:RNA polymerase sigma-70 factor (ECF subfamily)